MARPVEDKGHASSRRRSHRYESISPGHDWTASDEPPLQYSPRGRRHQDIGSPGTSPHRYRRTPSPSIERQQSRMSLEKERSGAPKRDSRRRSSKIERSRSGSRRRDSRRDISPYDARRHEQSPSRSPPGDVDDESDATGSTEHERGRKPISRRTSSDDRNSLRPARQHVSRRSGEEKQVNDRQTTKKKYPPIVQRYPSPSHRASSTGVPRRRSSLVDHRRRSSVDEQMRSSLDESKLRPKRYS
jgi:hypothetical protein